MRSQLSAIQSEMAGIQFNDDDSGENHCSVNERLDSFGRILIIADS